MQMEGAPFYEGFWLALRERITDFHRAAAPADAEDFCPGSFVLERVIEISCNVIISPALLAARLRAASHAAPDKERAIHLDAYRVIRGHLARTSPAVYALEKATRYKSEKYISNKFFISTKC